jgi:hypothetical protein
MENTTFLRASAIALGVAVLATQIGIGWDYLGGWDHWGGKAKTIDLASMILVFTTLAVAPMLIVGAFKSGHPLAGLSFVLAFGCWIAYSLPTTLGRTSEVAETKVQTAENTNKGAAKVQTILDDELQTARQRLKEAHDQTKWASDAATKRCDRFPDSDACGRLERDRDRVKRDEKDRQARVDSLLGNVIEAPATKEVAVGDAGSENLAWLISFWKPVTADGVRKSKSFGFAAGLELFLWTLLHVGFSPKLAQRQEGTQERKEEVPATKLHAEPEPVLASLPAPLAANEDGEEPPPGDRKQFSDDEALRDIRQEVGAGRYHGVVEYADRWGVVKSEGSKRITAWEDTGVIRCEQVGRFKLVTYVRPQLVKQAA